MAEIDYTKPATVNEAFEDVDKLFLNTPYHPDKVGFTRSSLSILSTSWIHYMVEVSNKYS